MDNPMGLNGFEFVEFSAQQSGVLELVFQCLGFTKVAEHRSKRTDLWRQGDINFIINYEPDSPAYYHALEHGPGACGLAFRVNDAKKAYERALDMGAQPVDLQTGPMELRLPAIKGIGGVPIYLIDRCQPGSSIYDIDFEYLPDVVKYPVGLGLNLIDHLTHNVYRGRMNYWAEFYEKFFNFREIKRFDIQGDHSGLLSRAMTAPDNKIRIPLNEEGRGGGDGQIEEFLMEYNGEGIQHIAFSCENLYETLDRLSDKGVSFMTPPPDSYYEMLGERLPGHGENVAELRDRGILLDGSVVNEQPQLLLQIFSEKMVGPIFFEFIERKGDDGFGEGNFQALFDSMERDQIGRGALEQAS